MKIATCRRGMQSTLGVAAAVLTLGASPALGDTLSSSMTSPAVSVSPNPTAGSEVTLTESGVSTPPATLTVSAQTGAGASCGQVVIDQAVVSGNYVHTSRFTPSQPGNYLICLVLLSNSGGSMQSQLSSFSITVVPAPPPGPLATKPGGSSTQPGGGADPATHCLVPRLLRHSVSYARHLLSLHHCTLGRVYYPNGRTLRLAHRRAHGHALRLIAVTQTPGSRSVLRYGGSVSVRLAVSDRRPAAPRKHRASIRSRR